MSALSFPLVGFHAGQPGLSAGRTSAAEKLLEKTTENPGDAKLRKAAQDFEAILIQTLWRSMKESFASSSEQDPAHRTLEDLSMQAMSTALAASGGLGIARMLIHAMEPAMDTTQSGAGGDGGGSNTPNIG
ncbi:MAG: hypothetical protein IH846_09635 [Acidobacteria bacterium]|nr:hypothetical protein [Acidobacteriota bacterium]